MLHLDCRKFKQMRTLGVTT